MAARRPVALPPITRQFVRYATVGVASNLALYLVYLAVTALGLAPKVAMTALYALGTAQTFLFNKHWSFDHRGPHGTALARYIAAYAAGYAINYAMLAVFVDRLGFPHQLVQGVAIVTVAVFLFATLRWWVFRS